MKTVKGFSRYGLLAIVLFLAIGFFSSAQGQVPITAEDPSRWQFTWTPYIWMTGIKGDVTVRGRDGNLDASFFDVFDDLNLALASHMELQKGRWSVYLDPWYAKLSDDKDRVLPLRGPTNIEATMKQYIVELGGTYRVGTWPIGSRSYSKMGLELLGGGRYWYTKAEVDFDPGDSRDKSKDWIDPIVGARLKIGLLEKLSLQLRGDIGGFGIGSCSDFSWNVAGFLSYDISKRFSIAAGYRALGVDYESGSGTSKVEYDLTYHGPVVGLMVRF